MALSPLNIASLAIQAEPDGASKSRRPGPAQGRQGFQETLQAMRQAMDLSMADRFLTMSENEDGAEDEERRGKAGGMDMLGLNMLSTLARLGPAPQPASVQPPEEEALGQLSRQFESGPDGSMAVGWDRVGGTSYGMFQLSSRQGTMDGFIRFLDEHAPQWAARLKAAGPADTGGRDGHMPRVWREIAAESPQTFAELQSRFITRSHYQPAAQAIGETLGTLGLDDKHIHPALREVIFSTAVQHGPAGASHIFEQAAAGLEKSDDGLLAGLINRVYELRGRQFGSSTPGVQQAVGRRFETERRLAQALLQDGGDALS